MHVFLALEQASVRFHLQAEVKVKRLGFSRSGFVVLAVDSELRVVGVLNPTACVLAVEFVVDVGFVPILVQIFHTPVLAGEIDHRPRTVVPGLHVEPRYACSICHFLIICTESRRDMHDTSTIFRGDIVTGNDTISSFARIDPREERFVFEPYQVRSFIACYDLRLQQVTVCIRTAEFFLIRIQAGLRQNDMIPCGRLYLHVVNLRSDTKGGIRRQSPRRGSPGDDETTVFHFEAGGTSEVFDITVATGLVQFVRRQSCAGSRRIGLNGVALVEETFFIKLFEQVPQGLDVLVVVRDIGVIEVDPVAHLFGEVGPLLSVFHHLATASRVVFIHGDLLADVLFGDTQHLLHTEFNGQTVSIPAGFAAHLETLHRLETAEGIFDGSRHDMVNTRHTVRRRRSFEEQELRMSRTGGYTLTK